MQQKPCYQHEKGNYKTLHSVKEIFQENWEAFLAERRHELRDVEKEEVEKMLSCKGLERGYFVYYCGNCKEEVIVPFGCNSRLCSPCSKRYTDEWACKLTNKILPGIEHKHLMFSVPDVIWFVVRKNRSLQKVLMDVAAETVKEMFSKTFGRDVEVGIICVLHPFGRDLVFKPHVHVVATNGGYTKDNRFLNLRFINYNSFHKKWQYNLLMKLKQFVSKKIIDYCFRKYPRGFVAYVRPEKIYSSKKLVNYIGRYLRHPAIANSRIVFYDKNKVGFCYEDHKLNKKVYKEMDVFDFMSAIIQHIPEKNFKLVRYYSLYSRKCKKKLRRICNLSSSKQTLLFKPKKNPVFYCPYCGEEMIFIEYCKKPP